MRRRVESGATVLYDVVVAWRRNRSRAAARLRSLREAAGLTQLDLAANSGVTHETISRLELARRGPRAETVRRLAAALDVAPADLTATIAPAEPEPTPSGHWLTADEAAAALDRTPFDVRRLIRAGRLRPAVRQAADGRSRPRWLVDAAAVAAYPAPKREGAAPRGPRREPPPGHLGVEAFVKAAGLAKATLYRRIASGEVASVWDGTRRWIPAAELARLRADPD
jgi:transcriptional regulator with XRE-family HTH domain